MSAFLTFTSLSAATPDRRILFENLTLSVGTDRIGLVGRNGSGKSTLLSIAAGDARPFRGTARRTGSCALFRQDIGKEGSVSDALGLSVALARLERIVAGDGTAEDLDAADWTVETRAGAALAETGLQGLSLDMPLAALSGGERTRIGLARIVLEKPDLLLLDEPTNNLDQDGRAAVLALIGGWQGGLMVASHDRDLLEHMHRIVELSPVGVRIVGGGWSHFAARRAIECESAANALDRSQAELRAVRDAAQNRRERKDRRDKMGRAVAAKRSEPKIVLDARAERAEQSGGALNKLAERQTRMAEADLEEARAAVEQVIPVRIDLPSAERAESMLLLSLESVTVDRGNKRLGPWTLSLHGTERVAIAGPNGAGKSTLIDVATGRLRASGGRVHRLPGRFALLDQNIAMLDPACSIADTVRAQNPTLGKEDIHAACARMGFRNRDAARLIGTLSGGERLRAAFAGLFATATAPPLLILDEPTNHLDMETVELLEQALADYDGALLVVSHDERFLDAVGIHRRIELSG